jgi:hypothetical protein
MYEFLCEHRFSFILCIFLGLTLLGHKFNHLGKWFFKVDVPFDPRTWYEGFSTSWQALVNVCLLILARLVV